MLAGFQCRDALRSVQVNRGVDMHRIDFRIVDQFLEALIPFRDTVLVADFVQLLLRALADGIHVRVRVVLVDRDEFLAKPQSDNCDIQLVTAHKYFPFINNYFLFAPATPGRAKATYWSPDFVRCFPPPPQAITTYSLPFTS